MSPEVDWARTLWQWMDPLEQDAAGAYGPGFHDIIEELQRIDGRVSQDDDEQGRYWSFVYKKLDGPPWQARLLEYAQLHGVDTDDYYFSNPLP